MISKHPKLNLMRVGILFIGLILAFGYCSKKEDNNVPPDFTVTCNDSARIYSDLKGTVLCMTNPLWYTNIKWITTNINGFGTVNLVISGATNADKVTVKTYGDGLIGDFPLDLDSKKSFNKDTVVISFTHFSSAPPTTEFEFSTNIKAYKGSDTLVVTFYSGKLKY